MSQPDQPDQTLPPHPPPPSQPTQKAQPTQPVPRPSSPSAVDATPSRQWMRRLNAGEYLFKEGDVDRSVFVLLDGRVEVLKDGEPIAVVGVSESFIGEISALTGQPRWATVRTVVPSTLLVVERVEELFRVESGWGLKLARVLADRLDRTNQRLKRVQALLEETRIRDTDVTLVETLKLAVADSESSF